VGFSDFSRETGSQIIGLDISIVSMFDTELKYGIYMFGPKKYLSPAATFLGILTGFEYFMVVRLILEIAIHN
jgi:hypothetical protein